MSLMSNTSWVSESGEPYQIKDSALTEEVKRAPTFTTLPLEIRLQIYGYNLSSFKRTLRRREDCDQHTKIKVFDTGLLAVNEQLNAETVPLLYANHTFHYSVSSRPSIPSHSLKWLKHASIGFTTRAGLPADAILATRIQELAASSPNLRTLTLHVIEIDSNASSMKGVQQLSPVGHWARAARGLLPRLDRLSIITCGVWARREDFRQFITAEGSQWAEEALIQ